jgi:hypothetical protein
MFSLRLGATCALLVSLLSACADSTAPGTDQTDTGVTPDAGEGDTDVADTTDPEEDADTSSEDTDTTTEDTAPDTTTPVCGDGAVNGTEVCDDSATVTGCAGGAECANDCSACETVAPVCGDGSVNGTELCDESATVSGCSPGEGCNATCSGCEPSSVPACGDGAVNGTEICDSSAAEDGCTSGFACGTACNECRPVEAPACGDGSVNGSEVCDGSTIGDAGCELTEACNIDCSACEPRGTTTFCGDGAINGEELCDATSVLNTGCEAGFSCASDCTSCFVPPRCGDGSINGAELCDGTAAITGCETGFTCAADCGTCTAIAATCGDGAVNGTETCDASATNSGCAAGEACGADCSACAPVGCGDGTVGAGEVCDATATVNGCEEGALCASDCGECTVCGNAALDGTEECDFDGIFGDFGVCTEGQSCASCRCVATALEIVEGVAFGTPLPGVVGVDLTLNDNAGFESFALLLLDADGTIVDFFQNGRDLLLELRRTPEDDPINYTLSMQFHFLNGFPETATDVYMVLFDADGVASNAVGGEIATLFRPLASGATCDPAFFVPQCEIFNDCDAVTETCTDVGGDDAFVLSGFDALADTTTDELLMTFDFVDPTGDMLGYFLLAAYDTAGDLIGTVFRSYDETPVSTGAGVWSSSFFVEGASENLGVPLADISAVRAVVFDRTDFEVSEPVFFE